MSVEWQIREAGPEDALRLQALYGQLCPEEAVQVIPERLTAIVQDDRNFVFVVTNADAQLCGTAGLSICADPMLGLQNFGVIENVILDPAFQGQGAARFLFDHILQVCRDNLCAAVMLLSASHRQEAHAFFEKAGFDGDRKRGFYRVL